MQTLTEAIEDIREALVRAERHHPDSTALKALHRKLWRAFREHGNRLGLNEGEISTLAGGGTPKKEDPPE